MKPISIELRWPTGDWPLKDINADNKELVQRLIEVGFVLEHTPPEDDDLFDPRFEVKEPWPVKRLASLRGFLDFCRTIPGVKTIGTLGYDQDTDTWWLELEPG